MKVGGIDKKRGSQLILPLFFTFISKGGAAFGAVFLLVVIGKMFGSAGVGVFSLLQGIVLIFATAARFGTGGALIRYVAKSDHEEGVRYFICSVKLSIAISLFMSCAFFLARESIYNIYDYAGIFDLAPGMVLSLFPIALSGVLAGYFKGVHMPVLASVLENGVISLIAVSFLLLSEVLLLDIGLYGVGWIYAISAWLVFLGGVSQLGLRSMLGNKIKRRERCDASFFRDSRSFLVIHMAVMVNSLLGLVVAGLFLGADELGYLRIAHQLAALITFVLIVIDMVFPPRYAALYQSKDMHGLERLGRKSVIYGLAVAAPIFVVVTFFNEWILGFFGRDFNHAGPALIVLALGQLFNVATGSVGFILNMTGHVLIMRNITLATSVLGLILIVVMTPVFGLLGAASALALAVVVQNAVAYCYVLKKLKLKLWSL